MDKVRIFISYSRKDREFLDRLLTHLAPLQSEGLIEAWTDREIDAGDHWDDDIAAALARAHIILLLISADFLASKYIAAKELTEALERERRGEAVVIPVLLKFADWSTSPFHSLQALPPGAKPITSWGHRDQAWTSVAQGLRAVVGRFHARDGGTEAKTPGPLVIEPETVRQDRVLDAAMAARIPLGKPSDLAVMVRKTDSAGLKAILGSDDEFTATPEDVKSKPFQMEFARDSQGRIRPAKLTVKLESPDFDPPEQSEEVTVPPDRDSEVTTFLLRPLFPGELVVKLKVFAQDGTNAIRLMRIISEASDRVVEGGRVIATIPISTVAASATAANAYAASAGLPRMPAPVAVASRIPDLMAAPRPAAAAPPPPGAAREAERDRVAPASAPKSRKRAWVLSSASAAAATVLIGTAIYLVPGGAPSPVASVSDAIEYPATPPLGSAMTSGPSRSPASEAPPAAPPPPPVSSGWEAEYRKGLAAGKSGNLESATKNFAEAARLAPSEAAPATALATTSLKLADQQSSADREKYLTAAVEGAKKAAALQPDSASAQYLQGLALEKSGEFADAEDALRQATKLDPDDANAWYALGLALAKQNKNEDARGPLEQAVRLDPANTDARLLLASVLAQQKAPDAKKQIEVLANDSSLSLKKRVVVERMQKTIDHTQ